MHAWCVTGTPVGSNLGDLHGLLSFLRCEPFCWSKPAWESLLKNDRVGFQQLFSTLAIRHTKAYVQEEVNLPPQRRTVITVPFTRVEQENYKEIFKEMIEKCQISPDGSCPILEDPDHPRYSQIVETMRSYLKRLRKTCSHAQFGIIGSRKQPKEITTIEGGQLYTINHHYLC